MKVRILVPGGAGYIGSHTVYALIESGYDVIVADNLETGHRAALHPDAIFYEGDIRNADYLNQLFSSERIDGVIHFAANSLVGESMQNPLKYYDNNINGTRVLLDCMLKHGVMHIVFSSTAATYGEPERIPILESDATRPTNAYGETKLAMERMFYWAERAHGLKYVSLRYFNACGAHKNGKIGEAHAPETHLVPLILFAALKKRDSIHIYGNDYDTHDGTCIRDYIHVCDLADAHILAMRYLLNGGKSEICNLGNGVGFSVREVIEAAERVVGAPILRRIEKRREGDPARLVASNEKARAILGFSPSRTSIEEIVADAWHFHAGHADGYASH